MNDKKKNLESDEAKAKSDLSSELCAAEPDWNTELKKILIDIAGSNVIGFNLETIDKLVRATNYLQTQFKIASKDGYEPEEVKSVIKSTCEILQGA